MNASPQCGMHNLLLKQARKPRSYASLKLWLTDSLTYLLTRVKCRATSVANKNQNLPVNNSSPETSTKLLREPSTQNWNNTEKNENIRSKTFEQIIHCPGAPYNTMEQLTPRQPAEEQLTESSKPFQQLQMPQQLWRLEQAEEQLTEGSNPSNSCRCHNSYEG